MTDGEMSGLMGELEAMERAKQKFALLLEGGWFICGTVEEVGPFLVVMRGTTHFAGGAYFEATTEEIGMNRHVVPFSRIVSVLAYQKEHQDDADRK